jgi:hypothetical protein
MSLAGALAGFNSSVAECDNLIAAAHRVDAAGTNLFSVAERRQITISAFLNLFIAWETFLEASMALYMIGAPTIGGNHPTRYVTPPTTSHALGILVGVQRYFDFGNHEYVRKMVSLYFLNGGAYEPHLSGVIGDLADMKTIRNACAHLTSTTQGTLETLALRLFGAPQVGIGVYDLLLKIDPNSHGDTVFLTYKKKVAAAAALIAG